MTQRDWTTIGGGVVIGAAVVLVLVWALPGISGRDTNTDVTLSMVDGKCTLGNATHVRVPEDNDLTWKIRNYCNSQKTVSIGSFRKVTDISTKTSGTGDCAVPGENYPFGEGARSVTLAAATDDDRKIKPTKGDIKLKANKLDGTEPEIYEFNICLDGARIDPWVIVER